MAFHLVIRSIIAQYSTVHNECNENSLKYPDTFITIRSPERSVFIFWFIQENVSLHFNMKGVIDYKRELTHSLRINMYYAGIM